MATVSWPALHGTLPARPNVLCTLCMLCIVGTLCISSLLGGLTSRDTNGIPLPPVALLLLLLFPARHSGGNPLQPRSRSNHHHCQTAVKEVSHIPQNVSTRFIQVINFVDSPCTVPYLWSVMDGASPLSIPYGHACSTCARAKVRCIPRGRDSPCER